jgi:hypothetical protein
VSYVGTALVGPPVDDEELEATRPMREDRDVELRAMAVAVEHERSEGRQVEDVSHFRDGRGFDVRSWREAPDGRVTDVRRIEVKGRAHARGDVSLCRTEWIAAHRHRGSFWLYVVYAADSTSPRLVRVQNPAAAFGDRVEERTHVTTYRIPAAAIEEQA